MVRLGWAWGSNNHWTVSVSSDIHSALGDQVSPSFFFVKDSACGAHLVLLLWRIKWNWQWVGFLPWHSQAVEHNIWSKGIVLAVVWRWTTRQTHQSPFPLDCALKTTKRGRRVVTSNHCFPHFCHEAHQLCLLTVVWKNPWFLIFLMLSNLNISDHQI